MCKKIIFIVVALVFVIGISKISYAMCGSCGVEAAGEEKAVEHEHGKTIDVGNTVCPVSGDKIDMSKKSTVEHEGKVYNLCCPACIEPFKKDPKKYSGVAEKEVEVGKVK